VLELTGAWWKVGVWVLRDLGSDWKLGGFRKNFGTHTKRKCEPGGSGPVGDWKSSGFVDVSLVARKGIEAGSIRVSLAVNRD
jgi:hypothetical protein